MQNCWITGWTPKLLTNWRQFFKQVSFFSCFCSFLTNKSIPLLLSNTFSLSLLFPHLTICLSLSLILSPSLSPSSLYPLSLLNNLSISLFPHLTISHLYLSIYLFPHIGTYLTIYIRKVIPP